MPQYHLRDATDADFEFLFEVHRATFRDYVERTWGAWDESWQYERFRMNAEPKGQVIVVDGEDAGLFRITIDRAAVPEEFGLGAGVRSDFIELMELAPRFQGRGIGTAILRDVIASAAGRSRPVTLTVLKVNRRAKALYERLGFITTGEDAQRYFMRRDGP